MKPKTVFKIIPFLKTVFKIISPFLLFHALYTLLYLLCKQIDLFCFVWALWPWVLECLAYYLSLFYYYTQRKDKLLKLSVK